MSTPMLDQYNKLKSKYPEALLLFRLGDFYEAFDKDAKVLSKELGITLTGRGKSDNRIPMAGIPHHALHQYLPKLVKAGHKVAIADQLEEAGKSKLVKRGVVKVITPGTLMDEKSLLAEENSYVAVLYYNHKNKIWALSYADLTTGEFKLSEIPAKDENLPQYIIDELSKLQPKELLLPRNMQGKFLALNNWNLEYIENFEFDLNKSRRLLLESFEVKTLKGFGIENYKDGITSAGVIYQYLKDTQKSALQHITDIKLEVTKGTMQLDNTTIRSLELIYPNNPHGKSVYDCLNYCKTSMGKRELRSWVLRPLTTVNTIDFRLNCVEEVIEKKSIQSLQKQLDEIVDLERLISRVATGSGNARDLLFLKNSLNACLILVNETAKYKYIGRDKPNNESLDALRKIATLLESSIREDAGITITEGGIIKPEYNQKLSDISKQAEEGKTYIKNLQEREIKKTGINSLKVGFNQVFGYYIEVSRSNVDKVPSAYIRKQTLANAERYITQELKSWEDKVLSAQSKASELEYEIFEKIRSQVLSKVKLIQEITRYITFIDVIVNFAYLAQEYSYAKPLLKTELTEKTLIKNGRHIVVERDTDEFIANDTVFSEDQSQIIITGPNMSGKSTYIRQTALVVLLAQIGCYVPAESAEVVIADRIFTRVGSADNLAAGESTFMVEMTEAANILNNATPSSLIILDEIGRGTSTYDGLSLAWAIVEYINSQLKSRTLFATHYHELTMLEEKLPGVINMNVEVKETDDEVLFMHRIIPGATDKSYGIYVAKIAGLPQEVVSRADDILLELEKDSVPELLESSIDYTEQLSFYSDKQNDEIREAIKSININEMTPMSALLKLKELQELDAKK